MEITVKRYLCPWCRRGRSDRRTAEAHAARCWRNPAARACKTCRNLERDEEIGDFCAEAVDLRDGLVAGCEFWREAS